MRCIFSSFLLTLSLTAHAQLTYTTNNGAITITGYSGDISYLTIPDTIDGLPVKTIGYAAFQLRPDLKSVTIPSNVDIIGDRAFAYCKNLSAISVDQANQSFSSAGGILFNKNQTTLLQYPSLSLGAIYTIPSSVTTIGDYAFLGCHGLSSVAIPDTVTAIGNYAFDICASLTNVTIGTGVSTIGIAAFYSCTNLAGVTVDDSNPFYSSVGGILFNKSQTDILLYPISREGDSYIIPNSVTTVESFAFDYCTSLTNLTIGRNVALIFNSPFSRCYNLTAFSVDDANSTFSSVGGILFNKSQTELYQYPISREGSSYTTHSTVTNIWSSAFFDCTNLTSVSIGSSVTDIGYYAFYQCNNLKAVYFGGHQPSAFPDVFDAGASPTVYYLPGTTGWESTFSGRPTVLWNPTAPTADPAFGLKAGKFGFNITGSPDIEAVVEACSDLSNPVWLPLSTNTLTGGSSHFVDVNWTNHPTTTYRFRSP